MAPADWNTDGRCSALVGRYATPLAILLIGLGIGVVQPVAATRNISLLLLCFGAVFNLAGARWIQEHGSRLPYLGIIRVWVNLIINTILVYMLGSSWSPVWLLLALTPLAMAIYSTRARTLAWGIGVSLILLAIHATRGLNSPLDWAPQVAHAVFIIVISLLVSDLRTILTKDAAEAAPG